MLTAAPIWVEKMTHLVVREGQDARFPCRTRPAIGERDANRPTWYKNGEEIKRLSKQSAICFGQLVSIT